jgi:hypothetical protein
MSLTRRGGWPYGHPPNGQFVLNTRSPQAQDLHHWWPTNSSFGLTKLRDYTTREAVDGIFWSGMAWRIWGPVGRALHFPANHARVRLTGVSMSAPYTISLWCALFNAVGAGKYLLDSQTGRTLLYARNGSVTDLGFYGGVAAVNTGLNIIDGEWHHVVVSIPAAGDVTLYHNGLGYPLAGTGNNGLGGAIQLGDHNTEAGDNSLKDGAMADIRFYDRALSGAEVWSQYINPRELYQPVSHLWNGMSIAAAATDLRDVGWPSVGLRVG